MKITIDPPVSGAENMRRDEEMLALGEPAVRLYGWSPATVSLGSGQTRATVDEDAVREFGFDVVARGTGGGGILHNEQEVTYAVVLPITYPGMPRDIPGSFAFISEGVIRALRSLGIPAEIERAPDATRDALCYVRRQGTNVVVNGRKISGGAQRRNLTHVLQHGTVIVTRDEERMARVFRANLDDVRAKVTSLELEGVRVSREELVAALVRGFGEALGTIDTPEAKAV